MASNKRERAHVANSAMLKILKKHVTKPKFMFLPANATGKVKQKIILEHTDLWKDILEATDGNLKFKKSAMLTVFKNVRKGMDWTMDDNKSKAWVDAAQGTRMLAIKIVFF